MREQLGFHNFKKCTKITENVNRGLLEMDWNELGNVPKAEIRLFNLLEAAFRNLQTFFRQEINLSWLYSGMSTLPGKPPTSLWRTETVGRAGLQETESIYGISSAVISPTPYFVIKICPLSSSYNRISACLIGFPGI